MHDSLGTRIHRWIVNHDDSKAFIVAYIGLAVVLSIWLGLFWLVAVVAVHGLFEVIRQRALHEPWRRVAGEALWELKLDVALVLLAFVVTLYLDLVLGVAGLQGVARAGAAGLRGGSRFAAWQRVLRGVLLSVDDAAQVARFAVQGGGEASEPEPAPPPTPRWIQPWRLGDRIAVGLGLFSLLLIFASPALTDHSTESAIATLLSEMHPFP